MREATDFEKLMHIFVYDNPYLPKPLTFPPLGPAQTVMRDTLIKHLARIEPWTLPEDPFTE